MISSLANIVNWGCWTSTAVQEQDMAGVVGGAAGCVLWAHDVQLLPLSPVAAGLCALVMSAGVSLYCARKMMQGIELMAREGFSWAPFLTVASNVCWALWGALTLLGLLLTTFATPLGYIAGALAVFGFLFTGARFIYSQYQTH